MIHRHENNENLFHGFGKAKEKTVLTLEIQSIVTPPCTALQYEEKSKT